MNQYALDMYRQMFLTLRRGQANGMPSKAKPIFILSVIEAIPQYNQNVFNVNDSFLVVRYKTNLELYTNKRIPLISVPFFHMESEPFYEILWKTEERPPNYPHTQSSKTLLKYTDGAKLDDELWELLQEESNRKYLKDVIIKTYLS